LQYCSCDVVRDVIDKHVYIWRIWLIGQLSTTGFSFCSKVLTFWLMF